MKLIIHSPCIYTTLALENLFSDFYSHIKGHFIIMDSREFKSVSEMYWLTNYYARDNENVKIVIILNKKFIKANRDILSCGVDIQDSLSRWGYIIKNIINDRECLLNSLNCLEKYSTGLKFSDKLLMAMSLISERKTVPEIAEIMNIKPKSAYIYVSKLKEAFHQPNINHLYSFLGGLVYQSTHGEEGECIKVRK